MVDISHANAYSEVLEILNSISLQEYNKIPKEIIEVFEKFSNEDYKFTYNPNISLDENNVSDITKTVIAILFRDYWATPYQKQKIIAYENYDRTKIERIKKEKYDVEELFKNKYHNAKKENVSMIKYEETFMRKILKKIRKIFLKK